MQYHSDGFKDGDPRNYAPAEGRPESDSDLPEKLDVLIVGSGPAGLTLAAQLAAYPQIQTRIVERKSGPITRGQADGVSCRSMEMFAAFGFADQVKQEAYWVNEATFWKPDPNNPNHIIRNGRIQDVEDGLSEMPHVILNQARVHDMFLNSMLKSPSRLQVDYAWQVVDLKILDHKLAFPVKVTLKNREAEDPSDTKIIRCRYVVGCDGASSTVRSAIGRELNGDYAYQSWGVMDVLAVTDFPDIRFKSLIKSATEGSALVIPREGGYLVRIYVELDQLTQLGKSKDVRFEQVLATANNIFQPYSLEVKEVVWWSVYEVGHSVTEKFDDVPAEQIADRLPCVFIAGDACHTHSAKAGQGMNVSMGDTFNLGWKLISVLTGQSAPELLHTYSDERQLVAQELIEFDHQWARIMAAQPESSFSNDDEAPLFQKYFIEHGRFTAGVSVKYQRSKLTGDSTWQHLAKGFEIGTRFHSAPVIRLGDSKPIHIGHTIGADIRWHVYAFANQEDPSNPTSAVATLCHYLETETNSPVRRYISKNANKNIDSMISVYGIFQQETHELEFEKMPSLLRPLKGQLQLIDYEKIFCSDLKNNADIFEMRRIDREQGCMVIVRPDQYVANILPLDRYDAMEEFFSGFLQ